VASLSLLLWLAGIFFLVGPVDSIILMRLGYGPRHWATVVGWLGLLASAGGFIASRPGDAPPTIRTLRLVDQVDGTAVAATDIVTVKSVRSQWVRMSLDKSEWWEPANQAARSFGPDRFVDAACRQDREGCRPDWIRLVGGEAQSWHGEAADLGQGLLNAKLKLHRSRTGEMGLIGLLSNDSSAAISDIQVETNQGNFRIGQSVGAGATVTVNAAATNQAIVMNGLPADVGDIAPERADRVEGCVKSGSACVYGQTSDGGRPEMLRAVEELER
jgi:hypothetical protein